MSNVRSYNDSSAVSIAYAIGPGTQPSDFSGQTFTLLPYLSEKFTMSKTPKASTAITSTRRPNPSKNTKGSASGGTTLEFGGPQFILDMMTAAFLSEWVDVDDQDPSKGVMLIDGEMKKYMCIEKTVKAGASATDMLYHERYYGTAYSDFNMKFSDGELITLETTTMSVTADNAEAVAGANGLGGSLAGAKVIPEDYEPADSSNNLTNVVLRDSSGDPMEVEFSEMSLSLQNSLREQPGLGKTFSAGIGFGKVGVTLSGEIYFFDHTLLNAHMQNERLSAEFEIPTEEGVFKFYLPELSAQTPSNNSEGENQDYKTKLTLSAEEGVVSIDGTEYKCCIACVFIPA